MGRWSSTYYDEVLGSKLKSLVCGAIERAKLEKDDPPAPTISYENFVQDLDHGDSFTTMLVEILVKELAERKTRPSSTDRHMIADRTAKSLRSLGHIRIFRDRSTSSRRPFSNEFFVSHNGGSSALDWDVLTQGAEDDDLEIDDDIARDTTRFHHNLNPMYHPFTDSNSTSSNATIRRSFPVQTTDPGTDDDVPAAPVGFPSRRSPPVHLLARHSSLTRQPSLRRPTRTRTNDFSEFTSRRRTTGRHEQASQSGAGPGSRAAVSGTGDTSSSMDIVNLLHNHQNALHDSEGALPVAFSSTSANRTFGRQLSRVRSLDERESVEPTVNPNFTPFALHSSGSSTGPAPSSSRMHVNAPRLRRGGVRAPEQYATSAPGDGYTHTVRISSPPIPGLHLHTLSQRDDEQRLPLPRRSSSAEMEYIIQTASERFVSRSPRAGSPGWGMPEGWNEPQAGTSGSIPSASGRQHSGTPTNLPTPRSISPENLPRE